jgi:hypothetical protein
MPFSIDECTVPSSWILRKLEVEGKKLDVESEGVRKASTLRLAVLRHSSSKLKDPLQLKSPAMMSSWVSARETS